MLLEEFDAENMREHYAAKEEKKALRKAFAAVLSLCRRQT